ncbi:Imm41 family immunity protein [uncultured Campylobacter sp.]|uniref:Imm41 family immunity protein n=1 Tax=uncultured Campylobacter sp. TaxID=218934 RepID=UPI002630E1C9|nr:Imm41 family immunity protein [uncultured Campylobacter sp.]
MDLKLLYQNSTNSDKFSIYSFVGKFIYQKTWSDCDYWELDKALMQILSFYHNKTLPKEIFIAILAIFNDVIGVEDKSEIYVSNMLCAKNSDGVVPSIYDRFERLNVMCNSIVFKEEFSNSGFWYAPKD